MTKPSKPSKPSKPTKMTGLTRLAEVTDPDAVVYVTDAFGEPMAAIYVHDLRTWVWAIARVESWLAHASPAARDECNEFMAKLLPPCDHPGVDALRWMLSAVRFRMAVLVNEVVS